LYFNCDVGSDLYWLDTQVAGGLALGLGALGAAVMHHGHKKEEVIYVYVQDVQ